MKSYWRRIHNKIRAIRVIRGSKVCRRGLRGLKKGIKKD